MKHDIENSVFVGRATEQATFKEVLKEVVLGERPQPEPPSDWLANDEDDLPANPDLPHVFLISGHGGIGKSRLLERLHHVAERARDEGLCRTLDIIRLEEGNRFASSRRGSVDAIEVLAFLAGKLKILGELREYDAANTAASSAATGNIENNGGMVGVGNRISQTYVAHADNVTDGQPDRDWQERKQEWGERLERLRTALAQDLRRLSAARPLVISDITS